jgi:hypothetical protein
MCIKAVKHNIAPGASWIHLVPEKFRTVEVYLEAVRHYTPAVDRYTRPDEFLLVPEKLRDEVRRRYESGE